MSRHHARNQATPSGPDGALSAAAADRPAGLLPDPATARLSAPSGAAVRFPGPETPVRAAPLRPPEPGQGAWLPADTDEVLLVTGFDFLQGEVERIVAAAGGLLRVVADVSEAAPYWDSAAAVLV